MNFTKDGRSSTVDGCDRLCVQDEPPRRLRQSVNYPSDPIPDVIDVKENQTALDQIERQARDRLCTRFAMQLVKAIAAWDAAEQGVARTRYTRQKMYPRGDDGDQDAPEDAKSDNT